MSFLSDNQGINQPKPANTAVIKTARNLKATHKKKNTMVIKYSPLCDATLFGGRRNIPLAVVKRNGVPVQNESDFMTLTEFPNPCAYNMAVEYKVLSPVMGELARTITEYLDKETGQPVLMLFPTTDVYVYDGFENNYMERLNHASRRDFYYQVNRLSQLIDTAIRNEMQKKRN